MVYIHKHTHTHTHIYINTLIPDYLSKRTVVITHTFGYMCYVQKIPSYATRLYCIYSKILF